MPVNTVCRVLYIELFGVIFNGDGLIIQRVRFESRNSDNYLIILVTLIDNLVVNLCTLNH